MGTGSGPLPILPRQIQHPRRMGKAQRAHRNDPDGHGLRPFAHPTPASRRSAINSSTKLSPLGRSPTPGSRVPLV